MENTDVSSQKTIEVRVIMDWIMVSIVDRLDAFNYDQVKGQLCEILEEGNQNIALNLEKAKFLSLPSIKYISNLADDLASGGRKLALVAPSEKLKRQIEIFASLEKMRLYRTTKDLEEGRPEESVRGA